MRPASADGSWAADAVGLLASEARARAASRPGLRLGDRTRRGAVRSAPRARVRSAACRAARRPRARRRAAASSRRRSAAALALGGAPRCGQAGGLALDVGLGDGAGRPRASRCLRGCSSSAVRLRPLGVALGARGAGLLLERGEPRPCGALAVELVLERRARDRLHAQARPRPRRARRARRPSADSSSARRRSHAARTSSSCAAARSRSARASAAAAFAAPSSAARSAASRRAASSLGGPACRVAARGLERAGRVAPRGLEHREPDGVAGARHLVRAQAHLPLARARAQRGGGGQRRRQRLAAARAALVERVALGDRLLEPALQLGRPQLQHLDRLQRLGRTCALTPARPPRRGGRGARRAPRGRSPGRRAPRAPPGARARPARAAARGRARARGRPARAPLAHSSHSASGSVATSSAGTRYVPRHDVGSREKRASGSDSNRCSAPARAHREHGQVVLARALVDPAAADPHEPALGARRQPLDHLDGEAGQRWDGG